MLHGRAPTVRAKGSSAALSSHTHTVKAPVTETAGGQALTSYVDGTERLSTGTIDDTWSGGHAGLFRATSSTTTTLPWDDFKCGLDNNADGDIDDAGTDYVYASYDFNDPQGSTWQKLALSHDAEADRGGRAKGNLTLDTAAAAARPCSQSDRRASLGPRRQGRTDDGLFKYRYDAWNPRRGGCPAGARVAARPLSFARAAVSRGTGWSGPDRQGRRDEGESA